MKQKVDGLPPQDWQDMAFERDKEREREFSFSFFSPLAWAEHCEEGEKKMENREPHKKKLESEARK